jgi:hypothetical protein
MTDLATDIGPIGTPSTVIDTETETAPSGGGVPRTLPDTDAKAPSLRDTIADVVKEEGAANDKEAKADPVKADVEAKPAKAEEKPEAKTERAPDGTFVAKPKEGEEVPAADTPAPANEAEKPGDAKHYPEPPKNFLPDSRELYRNVPRAVRRDIDVMVREHEQFREQATKANERYESIRPFDDLARSNGRDLRESLAKINNVENALQRDPVFGLNEVLKEVGPRKPDGTPYTIYEVASHIVQAGPEQFQQRLHSVQASQPTPPDPRLMQMEQELADAREQLVTMSVIEPFKAEHPRYDELKDTIAGFLQSGMIKSSLSAPERLEAAYVMAERHVPPSAHPAETEAPAPIPQDRAAESLSGSKSIKSAPGAVSADMEPERGGSTRSILEDEIRRMRRA